MFPRRTTRSVKVGTLTLGSLHPVAIQSMLKTGAADSEGLIAEARQLEEAGCQMVRVAVKDGPGAEVIRRLKDNISMPVVADIHFDHRLALRALANGADKIRINPGNIVKREHIESIVDKCGQENVPIRIGVNSGSVREHFTDPVKLADEMVREALECVELCERKGFRELVLSLKAPDVRTTVIANRKIAAQTDIPIHLGLTATGTPERGIIKTAVTTGALFLEGIGDTVRVSLTAPAIEEIRAAENILRAAGLRVYPFEIISCPTCGRAADGIVSLVREVDKRIKGLIEEQPGLVREVLTIAVMGCEVNGPGEAAAADIGAAFGRGKAALFRKGRVVRTVESHQVLEGLVALIKEGTEQ